jgi:hypothetical protein
MATVYSLIKNTDEAAFCAAVSAAKVGGSTLIGGVFVTRTRENVFTPDEGQEMAETPTGSYAWTEITTFYQAITTG